MPGKISVSFFAAAAAFGAPPSALPELIAGKSVTIAQLMALAPAGTADPSPLVYNEAFTALGGASVLALGCHLAALSLGPYKR